ncbi:MAG: hypothetical protein WA129_05560 [Acidovorax sp.]
MASLALGNIAKQCGSGARGHGELLGAERLVYATMGGDSMIVHIDEGSASPRAGDTIHLTPRENRLHWFDAQTSKRL